MAKNSKLQNQVRIIAGTLRGRALQVVDETGLRPTPSRVRETLFNWLQNDIVDSLCLDLFAGSGALGFEAASRGASQVVMVEKAKAAIELLEQNKSLLDVKAAKIMKLDAMSFLSSWGEPVFDIVFLDPPYGENILVPIMKKLVENKLVSSGSLIYFEDDAEDVINNIPIELTLLKNKKAGSVHYFLAEVR